MARNFYCLKNIIITFKVFMHGVNIFSNLFHSYFFVTTSTNSNETAAMQDIFLFKKHSGLKYKYNSR